MDWSNERYVRLYCNDTKSWLLFGWEGQAVFSLLLRKVDRSGMMDDVFDAEDVALMLGGGFPVDVASVGLERLMSKGAVQITDDGLLVPNFIEAQETPKSDAQRQRDSRESKRAKASVTKRDIPVTKRDKMSRTVTDGHGMSQPVTLTCADPIPVQCSARLRQKSASPSPTPLETMTLAKKYLDIFNAVFDCKCGARSIIEKKIETRMKDGTPPWQILCAPILQMAMDPLTKKNVRNFNPEMLLRTGNNKRTSENGVTHGATDWIERIYLSADQQHLDDRLTTIAAHFGLTADVEKTGCQLAPTNER